MFIFRKYLTIAFAALALTGWSTGSVAWHKGASHAEPATINQPQEGWDEGWDAYKRRDYATAFTEFMALAEQGDAKAQITLQIMEVFDESGPNDQGNLYKWRSTLSKQNFREALRWFRNAANQGDIKAWTLLGIMYDDLIVRFYFGEPANPQDRAKAIKLFRKAAEQGEVTAQKIL